VTRRVLLSSESPTLPTVIAAFTRHSPDARVDLRSASEVCLFDETGQLLVRVEAPLLVQAPGEAERLLGAASPPLPYYWTELSCGPSSSAQRLMTEVAASIGDRIGGRLA
jgi:hypothetical protein